MIIITDPHGSFLTMQALLAKCPKDEPIVCCGDLVDRGARSMQVVQYIIDNNIPCVKGNHEDMMARFGLDTEDDQIWLMNGGDKTLESYKKDGQFDHEKFEEHRLWMSKLPLYLEFKDVKNDKGDYLVISHSSIGKVWYWSEEKRKNQSNHFEEVVMWGRSPPEMAVGVYNVFGHTPHTIHDIRIKSFYANIDTGACFNSESHKIQGYGVLTALQFPSMQIFQQENID